MKPTPGRKIAYLTCILAASVVACGLLNFRGVKEFWFLGQLRSRDPGTRARAAESLGEMKSLRAVPSLIEEIRRDQAEVVEIGEALTFYGSGVVKRIVDQYVFSDPPRRRFGRSSAKDSCVILGPMGHALYSIGKEAIPIVEKQVEGHSYFDLEIQRRLDVLEAILRAWKNPEIAVRRIGQIGVPGADLVTPPQNSNPPPGGRRAGAR